MNLEVLSTSESMTLCRAAANLVLTRFKSLSDRSRLGDRQLSHLFTVLAGDMERNLVEVHQYDRAGWRLAAPDEEAGQRAALGFLPSLSKGGEGVRLDRESGFYLGECILEDLARFYGALDRQCCDEGSRELLLRWKSAVGVRLEFLRRVVL
jgi:hypothetical protein